MGTSYIPEDAKKASWRDYLSAFIQWHNRHRTLLAVVRNPPLDGLTASPANAFVVEDVASVEQALFCLWNWHC